MTQVTFADTNGSLTQVTFADTNGWYFDAGFTQKAGVDVLVSSLKDGKALYKKLAAAQSANSRLFKAAPSGTAADIRAAIKAGADVNARDEYGWTALMVAAQNNTNPDVVKALLAAGADVNARDKTGNENSWTVLMAALQNTNPDVVKVLLAAGAADVNDWFTLMRAVLRNTNPDVVKVLHDVWAYVNAGDEYGWTELMIAADNKLPLLSTRPPTLSLDASSNLATEIDLSDEPEIDLSDEPTIWFLGVTTIQAPPYAQDSDLTAIIDDYKKCTQGIALDLSVTKIKAIGKDVFKSCEILKAIALPIRLTSIEDEAFEGCVILTDVTILSSITSIGNKAFKGCTVLKRINIPDSITSIGDEAFLGCKALHITIPNNVTSIGNQAFSGCESLEQIKFADTSGWYFDKDFTHPVSADELASSLKDGKALYKKTR